MDRLQLTSYALYAGNTSTCSTCELVNGFKESRLLYQVFNVFDEAPATGTLAYGNVTNVRTGTRYKVQEAFTQPRSKDMIVVNTTC